MILQGWTGTLRGLVKQPHLNGLRGEVLTQDEDGRVQFALHDSKGRRCKRSGVKRVKEECIEFDRTMVAGNQCFTSKRQWTNIRLPFLDERGHALSLRDVVSAMFGYDEEMFGCFWKLGWTCAVLNDMFINLDLLVHDQDTDAYAYEPCKHDVRICGRVPDSFFNRVGTVAANGAVSLPDASFLPGVGTKPLLKGGQYAFIPQVLHKDPKTMHVRYLDQAGFEGQREVFVKDNAMTHYVSEPTVKTFSKCGVKLLEIMLITHSFYHESHSHVLKATGEKVNCKQYGVSVSSGDPFVQLTDDRWLPQRDLVERNPANINHILAMLVAQQNYMMNWPDLCYVQVVRRTPIGLFTPVAIDPRDFQIKEGAGGSGEAPKCVVCMESAVACMLRPCAHACLCQRCAVALQQTDGVCPMCRAKVKHPAENMVGKVLYPGMILWSGAEVVRREGQMVHLDDGKVIETDHFLP